MGRQAGAGTSRVVVVAGTSSGVGKTTVATALMAALREKGMVVQAFKAGPDFIDPMHHEQATGRPSINLDTWMLSEAQVLAAFHRHTSDADVAVVEGVMGLFDGLDGHTEQGSTAQLAKWLGAPVLLVLDCSAIARSAAAVVKGYQEFDSQLHLGGLLLNRVGGDAHTKWLVDAMLSAGIEVPVLGGLPQDTAVTMPERHHGLHMPSDDTLPPNLVAMLAEMVTKHVDLDALLAVAASARVPLPQSTQPVSCAVSEDVHHGGSEAGGVGAGGQLQQQTRPLVRIAVARDEAFCFYYHDSLALLRAAGAELVHFSPLCDPTLPPGSSAVFLGGGYPERHAPALAANRSLRAALGAFADAGGVIYAECGGLVYLSQSLQLEGEAPWPMVGLFPFKTVMRGKMALGYCEVTTTPDCPLFPPGLTVRGQVFHFSEIVQESVVGGAGVDASPEKAATAGASSPTGWQHGYVTRAKVPGAAEVPEGFCRDNVLASYVHLHFGGCPQLAEELVARCRDVDAEAVGAAAQAAAQGAATAAALAPLQAVQPNALLVTARQQLVGACSSGHPSTPMMLGRDGSLDLALSGTMPSSQTSPNLLHENHARLAQQQQQLRGGAGHELPVARAATSLDLSARQQQLRGMAGHELPLARAATSLDLSARQQQQLRGMAGHELPLARAATSLDLSARQQQQLRGMAGHELPLARATPSLDLTTKQQMRGVSGHELPLVRAATSLDLSARQQQLQGVAGHEPHLVRAATSLDLSATGLQRYGSLMPVFGKQQGSNGTLAKAASSCSLATHSSLTDGGGGEVGTKEMALVESPRDTLAHPSQHGLHQRHTQQAFSQQTQAAKQQSFINPLAYQGPCWLPGTPATADGVHAAHGAYGTIYQQPLYTNGSLSARASSNGMQPSWQALQQAAAHPHPAAAAAAAAAAVQVPGYASPPQHGVPAASSAAGYWPLVPPLRPHSRSGSYERQLPPLHHSQLAAPGSRLQYGGTGSSPLAGEPPPPAAAAGAAFQQPPWHVGHPPSDKIVSLSPGATEMLWALGLGNRVVAVSDACDHPPAAAGRAKARHSFAGGESSSFSSLPSSVPSSAADSPSYAANGGSADSATLHWEAASAIDEQVLARERPGLIVFEEEPGDGGFGSPPPPCSSASSVSSGWESVGGVVRAVLSALVAVGLQHSCRVVCVRRRTLADVLDSIQLVGEAAGVGEEAARTVDRLRTRLRRIAASAAQVAAAAGRRPRVLVLQSLQPLRTAGWWAGDMAALAGGLELAEGGAGDPPRELSWKELQAHAPDVLVVAGMHGGSAARVLSDLCALAAQPGWWLLPAVRASTVYVCDAVLFCRAGPRLVEGVEALAHMLHDDAAALAAAVPERAVLKLSLRPGQRCRQRLLPNYFVPFQ